MKPTASPPEELQRLQNLTEQCRELVLIAKPQAAKYTEYYVASAEELRRQADRTRFPELRTMLLRIAELHRRLARHGEQTEGVPETSYDAAVDRKQLMHDAESPTSATEQGKKSRET
jgi:hypothetical protein